MESRKPKHWSEMADESTKKILRIIMIVFCVIFLGFIIVVYFGTRDQVPRSRSVEIEGLEICDISYSQGEPTAIRICGLAINNEPNTEIGLHVVLATLPKEKSLGMFKLVDEDFDDGFFSLPFYFDEPERDFVLKIYYPSGKIIHTSELSIP